MSRVELQERKAIEQMANGRPSAAYAYARRKNIPVTVVRGDTIYRVTKEETVVVGKVAPAVKVAQRVVNLK